MQDLLCYDSSVKKLAQAMLRPFGLRLARVNSMHKPAFGAEVLFGVLKQFGFEPRHVVDVGANHGNWTRMCVGFFPSAQYTLVEPQDELKAYVQDLIADGRKIRWINAGASNRSGTFPFFVSHRDDSSNFIAADNGEGHTVQMEVLTLDDLLRRENLPIPELLKIDAEGLDIKVVEGAKSLLGKTDVILLEASVLCPYENTVAEAVALMDRYGYRLIDVTEINRSPKDNVLWLTELAFLRKDSTLLAAAKTYE